MLNTWHKSSYSGANNDCVEVREHVTSADVRDSKHRRDGQLTFPTHEWTAFLRSVKEGEVC